LIDLLTDIILHPSTYVIYIITAADYSRNISKKTQPWLMFYYFVNSTGTHRVGTELLLCSVQLLNAQTSC